MTASPIFPEVELVPFFRLERVPVFCNVLLATREEALAAPKGDIELGYCPMSGLVWNRAFDEELVNYSPAYDASLHFSPTFVEYARSLAQRLVKKHRLENKTVLEVGCGKGEFLAMLCEAGDNKGVGFDASFAGEPASDAVTVVKEPFNAAAAERHPDLIISKHVLEHVSSPREFLAQVLAVAERRRTPLYFEVPNGLWTLRDLGIWDVIYEHIAYYTASSLTRLFVACGFEVDEVWTAYNEQFLCIEAKPAPEAKQPEGSDADVREVVSLCEAYGERFRERRDEWSQRLAGWHAQELKVALWGAGSKGVTFLNVVDGGDRVVSVVDKNPRKYGRFVPGTGQEIAGPESLRQTRPDRVMVMNPIYETEIRDECAGLGTQAEIVVV